MTESAKIVVKSGDASMNIITSHQLRNPRGGVLVRR